MFFNWAYSSEMTEAQATYERFGPFDYGLEAEEMVDIGKWKGKYNDHEAIFFGQLKDGEPSNFGIMVTADSYT